MAEEAATEAKGSQTLRPKARELTRDAILRPTGTDVQLLQSTRGFLRPRPHIMAIHARDAHCFLQRFFLTACGFTGSLLGGKVAAQSATDESTLRDSLHSFTDVYALVEAELCRTLNTEQVDKAIYDGAIPGMLHVLDPHSNFYDPKAYAQMREDQHGKYYGVGMQIQPQDSEDRGACPV